MANISKTLASVLGSLGLVLSTVSNFHQFSTTFDENFWVVLIISFVLSVAAAWPETTPTRVLGLKETYRPSQKKQFLRYRWIIIIILVSLGVGLYRYHVVKTKTSGDAPKIKPGEIPLEPGLSIPSSLTAYAQTQRNSPKLIQFTLRSEKTLFLETNLADSSWGYSLKDSGMNSLSKVYELSWELAKPIQSGRCNKDFDAGNALRVLRSYSRNNNKSYLLKYLESEDQVKSLKANHPDIVNALKPSRAEWGKLDREDYYAILNWSRNCIGIYFPVFLVVIENPTNRDLLISEIKYDIKNLIPMDGGVGVPSGPLTPTATYSLPITEHVGIKSHGISPPFRIPPASSGSFELQLYLNESQHTQVGFVLNVEFLTNQSPIKSDRFFLVMAPQRG
jgi:hypothetical protein